MDDLPPPLRNEPRSDQSPLSDPEVQKVHAQLMREKEEPTEGFPPLPIALLFLFSIVIFICGIYLGERSAGFSAFVYDPNYDPATAAAQTSARPAFDPIARGQRLYSNNCAQCHQADGNGLPGVYPPLVGSSWVTDTSVVPTAILLNGLMGPIQVKGNEYNGNMPAFGSLWSDRDIGAVLTYIRQEWGNQAPPISEEQVAEARSLYGSRASPWTGEEVLGLPALQTVSAAPEEVATGEEVEAQEEDSGESGTTETADPEDSNTAPEDSTAAEEPMDTVDEAAASGAI